MPDGKFSWDVFVSYNSNDTDFVKLLHRALVRYTPPGSLGVGRQHLRAFEFGVDMVGTDYDAAIQEKLVDSKKLVLICSPRARQSKFVADEIERFTQARGVENIVPVLLWGEPNNAGCAEELKAFPEPLCQQVAMPLAVNFREFKAIPYQPRLPWYRRALQDILAIGSKRDRIGKGIYESSWYHLLANIYGLPREVVEERERRRRRKRRRIWTTFITIMVLGISVLVGLYLFQKKLTEGQVARNQWAAGQHYRDAGQPVDSAHWFAKAVDGPDKNLSNAARLAMTDAIRGSKLEQIINDKQVKNALVDCASPESAADSSTKSLVINTLRNSDGSILLCWGENGDIDKIEASAGYPAVRPDLEAFPMFCQEEKILEAVFNDDQSQIVSWGDDKIIRTWAKKADAEGACFEPMHVLEAADFVDGARIDPTGTYVLGWARMGPLWVWDVSAGKQEPTVLSHEKGARIDDAGFSREGNRVASWGTGNMVYVWQGPFWKQQAAFKHPDDVHGAIFNDHGTRVLSWGMDQTIRLWDVASGAQLIAPLIHAGSIKVAAFYDNETHILSWGDENLLRLWKIQPKGQIIPAMDSELVEDAEAELADDSQFKRRDKVLVLSKVDNKGTCGDEILLAHSGQITTALFDSKRKRVLSASKDGKVRLWDRLTGELLLAPMSHGQEVNGARFNVDETRILSWGLDGTVRLWDISSGMEVIPPLRHPNSVKLAWFKDETTVLSVDHDPFSKNETIRSWDLSYDQSADSDSLSWSIQVDTGTKLDKSGELVVLDYQIWTCMKKASGTDQVCP